MAEARVSGTSEEVADEDLPADKQAEILAQTIRAEIGGEARLLPIRTIVLERPWMELVVEKAGEVAEQYLSLDPAGYTRLMRLGSETILDLVLSYDRTNALGGREYVE